MNNFSELKDIIQLKLSKLESSRKVRYGFYIISHLMYFLAIVIFLAAVQYPDKDEKSFIPMGGMILAIILSIAIFIFIKWQSENYVKHFKSLILEEFLIATYPEMLYDKGRMIAIEDFKESKLFTDDLAVYSGEDYFEGVTADSLKFQFSELSTSYKEGDNLKTLFDGVFFILNTPAFNFPGLLIISKNENLTSGSVNPFKASLKPMSVARLNPQLHALCDFYGTNEEASYNIINSKTAAKLEDIAKNWTKSFRINFYKNRIYIGLNKTENLFHVNISTAINSDELIDKMQTELGKCIDFINDFSKIVSELDSASLNTETTETTEIAEIKENEKELGDDFLYDHLIDFE